MEDTSKEEKQNFLRENILEKGYDINQFISFLQSQKGEAGVDISNWSINDLNIVVKEFISKNSIEPESEPQQPEEQLSQPNQNIEQNQQNNAQTTSNISQNSVKGKNRITLTEEDFGLIIPKYIECLKSETTELSKHENVEITVKEPTKVNKGFFSKTFINFLVTTNPINANVRRKHADFVWLRERLSIIFNLNVLPHLIKKVKIDDKKMNKKMRNLEVFLIYLAKDPLIKNSHIFYDFLTIENDAEFEERKKIYNKYKTPIELKDIKTINGKMKINITSNKERLLDKIKDNSALNETALKKFFPNFKLLKQEMNVVINRVLSFGPFFDTLIKISASYLDNSIILESYNQMKNIFITWVDILKKQNNFFFDVKEYLKILSGNYHHLRELVQYVQTIKVNYNKIAKNLISKKTELFRKQDINGWQLDINDKNNINDFYSDRIASYKKMCFKETNNVIAMKEKYGYHLNKIIKEYQRLRNINTIENKNKVIQLSKMQSQMYSDYFKTMEKIIGIIEECVEKYNSQKKDIEENFETTIESNEKENNFIKNEEFEDNQNILEDNKEIINQDEKILEKKEEENRNKLTEEKNDEQLKEKEEIHEENNEEEK